MAWEAASHWWVCLAKRMTVAVNARLSSSIRFSLINASWTPPFTVSTKRSETLIAVLIASFFAFSVFKKNSKQNPQFQFSTPRVLKIPKPSSNLVKLKKKKRHERKRNWPVSSRSLREVWWWSWISWSREASKPLGSAFGLSISAGDNTRARATGRGCVNISTKAKKRVTKNRWNARWI